MEIKRVHLGGKVRDGACVGGGGSCHLFDFYCCCQTIVVRPSVPPRAIGFLEGVVDVIQEEAR